MVAFTSDIASEAMGWATSLSQTASALNLAPEVVVGATPKDEVLRIDKARLFRFRRPEGVATEGAPVILVHGLVGRYTIADLQDDRSTVRDMLNHGVDLYVADWGYPDLSDRFLTLDDYICGYLDDFVNHVLATTGANQLRLMGICEGGVFCIAYAALNPDKINGLIVTITPVDFHADKGAKEEGFLNLWLRALETDDIENMVDAFGNLPGPLMGAAFQAMAPKRALTKYNIDLIRAAGDASTLNTFMRMEKWLDDRPDHPGAAAKQFLTALYKENRLVHGTFQLDGRKIDLGNLTMPVLNIYALKDHIVPAPCARALGGCVGTRDYSEIAMPCGHVGIYVSAKSRGVVGERVSAWLSLRNRA